MVLLQADAASDSYFFDSTSPFLSDQERSGRGLLALSIILATSTYIWLWFGVRRETLLDLRLLITGEM